MQSHNVQPKTKFRTHRRIGRGGKRGTYSGRGIKGLGARAGGKYRPAERELLKKIPKLRGYKFKSFQIKQTIVNLSDLSNNFKEGETVSPDTLNKAGLIRKVEGRLPKVKILGKGELKKKLVFKGVSFSKSVQEQIKS
ncbi:MAG: uL15 family ribosomal protein [bacterium]|nr:uL15 family ribosomal protein [bacterium]